MMRSSLFPTASGKPATDITFRANVEWKLQDMWIGAYWKRSGNCVDLWICFVPCVPLHVCWHWHDPDQ